MTPEALLDALPDLPFVALMRRAWPVYAAVNAAHLLGIALTLGAILPLDLRLIGVLRAPPLPVIGGFLSRTAAAGVALALLTGLLLFSVQPRDYLANPAFRIKLPLLAVALTNVALIHRGSAWGAVLRGEPVAPALRAAAAVSALSWIAVLGAGRVIGFL